jgi:hypothetical protein
MVVPVVKAQSKGSVCSGGGAAAMGHVKSSTDVAGAIAGLACERSSKTPLIR